MPHAVRRRAKALVAKSAKYSRAEDVYKLCEAVYIEYRLAVPCLLFDLAARHSGNLLVVHTVKGCTSANERLSFLLCGSKGSRRFMRYKVGWSYFRRSLQSEKCTGGIG